MALRFLIGTKSCLSPLSFIRLNRSFLRNFAEEEATPEKNGAENEEEIIMPSQVKQYLNEVHLIGRLIAEPMEKELNDFRCALFATLITEHYYKNQFGNISRSVVLHQLIFRNEVLSDFAANHLTKGSKIYVSGSLINIRLPVDDGASRSGLTCVRVDKLTPLSKLVRKKSLNPQINN